ncbi:NAD(P) transhydrogenase subunit alpha [Virgisporangium aliadipatigenens]|uniref:proton-translocating NAD(P)(+) transhydrogenase n=1 Tax=Virgisporangium aliadipatigenens TaxID=741659 RepID=A0A8J3YQD9_9ACTN|nr:NAD(P) transhydrogenase subunit alpha [Virgisporangium aliadipatigenens]GIJ48090.1 NAD(P) transhydrogenase subunit alpha [Virgisporangium aliadipatigenens]
MATIVAVVKHRGPAERRVALAPDAVPRLSSFGIDVIVESGAGTGAWWTDDAYRHAGAEVVSRAEALIDADVVLTVVRPDSDVIDALRPGQTLVGLLAATGDPPLPVPPGVTLVDLCGLPRRLSRAQEMDALTSQANVAGYKAVLVAADAFGGFFPMLMTAAGTTRPARVLVLGAGVAGLQAIGTARRLGAVVTAFDIRPETRDEVTSVGAAYLDLDAPLDGGGAGGYARALSTDETRRQQDALAAHVARYDVVIATARVPGRRAPLLVPAGAIDGMAPGAVFVDLAAGPDGGNVAGSVPDATIVTPHGVTIIGAPELAARMPVAASEAFSRNLTALLRHVVRDGELTLDPADEICAGLLVTPTTTGARR